MLKMDSMRRNSLRKNSRRLKSVTDCTRNRLNYTLELASQKRR